MSRISEIDRNLEIVVPDNEGTTFFNALDVPFEICGVFHDENGFFRMPRDVADATSDGVGYLNRCTAGGRVRFATDANKISIKATLSDLGRMPHFAFTGSVGFDLYVDGVFGGSFVPPMEGDYYESSLGVAKDGMHEICINFPLYSGVVKLEIGLPDGSTIMKSKSYSIDKPIVYYGSSITQGGCASRPGNSYPAIISRMLDVDHVNLGFSGSAKGEDAIADYISELEMSAFVYDYDYNADDEEYLKATHERMFLRIRKAQSELPIIIVSRPEFNIGEQGKARRSIIKQTYENAIKRGDNNVYFVDGGTIFDDFGRDSCTVDTIHPNDLGFMCMGTKIGGVLEKILK